MPSGSRTSACARRELAQRDAVRASRLHAPARRVRERLLQLGKKIDRRRQRRLLAVDQRLVEAHREVAPEDRERRLAAHAQRPRPLELTLDRHREQVARTALQLHLGMEVGDEMQRRDLDQHVVADVALDAEAVGGGVELRARAELHGVGGDREVGLAGEPRIVARRERNRYARELGEIGRRREARVQSADGEHEGRPRARTPARAQRHRAGQRVRVREPRIDEHAVDRGVALVEIDHADDVDVDPHQIVVRRRQAASSRVPARAIACARRTRR